MVWVSAASDEDRGGGQHVEVALDEPGALVPFDSVHTYGDLRSGDGPLDYSRVDTLTSHAEMFGVCVCVCVCVCVRACVVLTDISGISPNK